MNKFKLTIYLIAFFGLSASAQESFKIWGDNPSTRKKNRAVMQVFKANENPSGISIIICPGGSYRWLGRQVEGTEIAQWLNQNNITAFVLYYRVGMFGNRHPAMIQDMQRAIQLVKENSEKYGINPEKVGLMGFSAGGHLVGTAGIYFDTDFLEELGITSQVSMRPAFVAMLYPVITMTNEEIVHERSRRNLLGRNPAPELVQKMSLELNVRLDTPPIFLMQPVGDAVVDYRNAVNFANALTEKKVPHVFHLFDEPGHGFGIREGDGEARLWHRLFIPWLEEIMNVDLKTGQQK
jgi:acetyl esterase/lipase